MNPNDKILSKEELIRLTQDQNPKLDELDEFEREALEGAKMLSLEDFNNVESKVLEIALVKEEKKSWLWISSIAASLALIVGITYFFVNNSKESQVAYSPAKEAVDQSSALNERSKEKPAVISDSMSKAKITLTKDEAEKLASVLNFTPPDTKEQEQVNSISGPTDMIAPAEPMADYESVSNNNADKFQSKPVLTDSVLLANYKDSKAEAKKQDIGWTKTYKEEMDEVQKPMPEKKPAVAEGKSISLNKATTITPNMAPASPVSTVTSKDAITKGSTAFEDASYIGGETSMREYLKKNITATCATTIKVTIKINKIGKVSFVKETKVAPNCKYDLEKIKQVLIAMPAWNPAKSGNTSMEVIKEIEIEI